MSRAQAANSSRSHAPRLRKPISRLVITASLVAQAGSTMLASGCVPVIVAAAAGGATMLASDRRPVRVQLDDQTIETSLATAIASSFGDKAHVNATSYNGVVLLTGEAPDEATWSEAGNLARTTAGVRSVHNELALGANSELSTRTNDAYLTSLTKTRITESSPGLALHVKVVTERGIVYLMGVVSPAEGAAAAEIASKTAGVIRVVKVFEYTE